MNRKAYLLSVVVVLALTMHGCSTNRKNITTAHGESQITSATRLQHQSETRGKTTVVTDVNSDEHRNIVIDFTTMEFRTDNSDRHPGETAAPRGLKSITRGRAVINSGKTESITAEASIHDTIATDTHVTSELISTHQRTSGTKTEEKPATPIRDRIHTLTAGLTAIIILIFIIRSLSRGKD
ncbi:MAG: hypothetical protein HFJ91_07410 [Muribaculaceae bacterium]|nr:hypothetical protein [Muribaculaceae bacterium]